MSTGARGPSAPWLMLGAALLFSMMAVCVKWASALYGAGELVFYRSVVGALFIFALTRVRSDVPRTRVKAKMKRAPTTLR